MGREEILGFIRHGLTFVGGLLVARGVADQAMVAELVGGLVGLIGVVWSAVDKFRTKAEIKSLTSTIATLSVEEK